MTICNLFSNSGNIAFLVAILVTIMFNHQVLFDRAHNFSSIALTGHCWYALRPGSTFHNKRCKENVSTRINALLNTCYSSLIIEAMRY